MRTCELRFGILAKEKTMCNEFWERLTKTTDHVFADKFRACINMIFTNMAGTKAGRIDICFDCPATAEMFLHSFAAWACREMASAHPGYAVANAMCAWLDRELGAGHGINIPNGPEFEDSPMRRVHFPEGAFKIACEHQRAKV